MPDSVFLRILRLCISIEKKAVLIAYRVKFTIMHPAFEAMFHLMPGYTRIASPEFSQDVSGN